MRVTIRVRVRTTVRIRIKVRVRVRDTVTVRVRVRVRHKFPHSCQACGLVGHDSSILDTQLSGMRFNESVTRLP